MAGTGAERALPRSARHSSEGRATPAAPIVAGQVAQAERKGRTLDVEQHAPARPATPAATSSCNSSAAGGSTAGGCAGESLGKD